MYKLAFGRTVRLSPLLAVALRSDSCLVYEYQVSLTQRNYLLRSPKVRKKRNLDTDEQWEC